MKAPLILAAGLSLSSATAHAAPTVVAMDAQHWDLDGVAGWGNDSGIPVLKLGSPPGQPLKGGGAELKSVDLATGVIEFDVKIVGERDFAGPAFHAVPAAGGGNAELFYLRPHMDGKPDSMQYNPVVNGSWTWQLFTGEGFEAQFDYPLGKWFHLRLDIYQSSALVSIDGKPALHIPHLMSDSKHGAVQLNASGGTEFAHFSYEAITDYRDPIANPPLPPLHPGTVGNWQVSPAMTKTEADRRAAVNDWRGVAWKPIATEFTGAANLSKAGPDGGDRHSYIARFHAASTKARVAKMDLGFSDAVRVYVNGTPLYEGDDSQYSRDYRFLGHVGFWDTLYVPLRAGSNQIAFVVTDPSNGGTAAAARFAAGQGVTVVP